MRIAITGGSGFLGRALTTQLQQMTWLNETIAVTWVSRHASRQCPDNVQVIDYEQLRQSNTHFDIIINLAGAGIADKRWTQQQQKNLYNSRLQPTQAVLDYITQTAIKPTLLVSGSAIGWYGVQSQVVDETSAAHDEFTHRLCDKWEKLALSAEDLGVPTTMIRTGVVIAPTGGMVGKLRLSFSLGLGGKLGDGQQFISWVSLTDWIRAVCFILENHLQDRAKHTSIYNLTAPQAVTNAVFTHAMGVWLKRPTVFCQPKALLELIFGDMSVLLLGSQQVIPQVLIDQGFEFMHNDILSALVQQ